MTAEQERKLTRIKNYHTRYEAIITDGTITYLLAYICGKSFSNLYRATANRVAEVNKVTNAETWIQNRKLTAGTFEIKYSGRTQREAILDGEYPYVGSVAGINGTVVRN